MSLNEKKFQALLEALSAKVTIPKGFDVVLKNALIKAGFTGEEAPARMVAPAALQSGVRATPKGGRRTGYNIFYSARNAALKQEGMEDGRQAQIVSEWKSMSEEEKDGWRRQATPATTSPIRKTGVLTGYQLYVRTQMAVLKGDKAGGSDKMRTIAAKWKLLPKEEQVQWSTAAKEGRGAPVAPVAAEAVPDPEDESQEDPDTPKDDQ